MSDANPSYDGLVNTLVEDLRPVRRLRSPWLRASLWLGVTFAAALVLAWFADMSAVEDRLMASPDMWLATLGSTLTAALAAFAAFQLALPDRSPWWSLLPLPGLVLWIAASGLGCARTWLIPGTADAALAETGHCLRFILGLSIPLSVAILLLLRQGYSLFPSLMGAVAGLAVAAAAATLLVFFHPYDATATDLLVHAVAIGMVVVINRLIGNRLFRWRFGGAKLD